MRPSITRNNKTYFILDELSEFTEKVGRRYSIEGKEIAVFLLNGKILAFEGECPHQGNSLAEGFIENDMLVCAAHGWKFKLQNGEPCTPGACPIKVYDTFIDEDVAWIHLEE